jgi:copper chaperone NosL
MTNSISKPTRILLIITAVLLVSTLFLPLWLIELAAPQYPEGLVFKIYTDGLGGQVEIINGLNHYIGMATLHSENFIEFTLLPYIIGGFALISLLLAIWGGKKTITTLFVVFLLFGIVSMVDFWRWEYDYGHNLDPNAAIIVPGMAYQPPLIGFKQLLNFGAYSIPDIGGWLIIVAGVLMLAAVLNENEKIKKILNKRKAVSPNMAVLLLVVVSLMSCDFSSPVPIKLNSDACDYCKMTISDGRFGTEIVTQKGRCYKFDDVHCMTLYYKENPKLQAQYFFVHDFKLNNVLIDATTSSFVKNSSFKSPMGGNTAAVRTNGIADELMKAYPKSEVITWTDLLNE